MWYLNAFDDLFFRNFFCWELLSVVRRLTLVFFFGLRCCISNRFSYSSLSKGSIKLSGSLMFGGIITSIFALCRGGVGSGDDSGVTAFMALLTSSSCKLFRFKGSEIFPPSRNLVGGMNVSLRGLL